jgi:hypothetical protein
MLVHNAIFEDSSGKFHAVGERRRQRDKAAMPDFFGDPAQSLAAL